MSWKLKFDEEKRLERAALKKRAPDANKLSGMCGKSGYYLLHCFIGVVSFTIYRDCGENNSQIFVCFVFL